MAEIMAASLESSDIRVQASRTMREPFSMILEPDEKAIRTIFGGTFGDAHMRIRFIEKENCTELADLKNLGVTMYRTRPTTGTSEGWICALVSTT